MVDLVRLIGYYIIINIGDKKMAIQDALQIALKVLNVVEKVLTFIIDSIIKKG